jgi:TRAP-type C4-dicarboxylate transport system permease small subunit
MYERLLFLSKLVDRALKWYLVFLMAMLVGLTFGQVFSRYVMQSSWAGTEEWSRLVLVWITFMGTAVAVRRNKLIRIEAIEELFPPKVKVLLSAAFDLVLLSLCLVIAFKGWEAAEITTSQSVAGTPFSYAWFVSAAVVGSALISVYLSLRLIGQFLGAEKEGAPR